MYTKLIKTKMNTTLFIGLFFSIIIAIKDGDFTENVTEELEPAYENVIGEEGVYDEYGEHRFECEPSESLREMENDLPTYQKEFVKDGMVKKTVFDVLAKSMNTAEAQNGWANLKRQWKLMLDGPEASRVVGTFGENLKMIMTTNRNANVINVVMSTGHELLRKIAVETRASGLETILQSMFAVAGSPNTPHIVNKIGQLTIMSVQKPRHSEFIKRFFDEICNLLEEKNIVEKMDNYFSNMISMMTNLRS